VLWTHTALLIIAFGVTSRMLHTGFVLIDKYLGDALYAALCYVLLRMLKLQKMPAILVSLTVMTCLELFQLTGIPLKMARSGSLLTRVISKLLGTEFRFADLLSYAAGVGVTAGITEGRRNAIRISGRSSHGGCAR
jgi:Protein of unknown function (DUF2809)